MQPQYHRANAEHIDAVGEDYQSHSHEVVHHLLFEVLQKTVGHHQDKPLWLDGHMPGSKPFQKIHKASGSHTFCEESRVPQGTKSRPILPTSILPCLEIGNYPPAPCYPHLQGTLGSLLTLRLMSKGRVISSEM